MNDGRLANSCISISLESALSIFVVMVVSKSLKFGM